MCFLIVVWRVPKMLPMSRLVIPLATQFSTWVSRAVTLNLDPVVDRFHPLATPREY